MLLGSTQVVRLYFVSFENRRPSLSFYFGTVVPVSIGRVPARAASVPVQVPSDSDTIHKRVSDEAPFQLHLCLCTLLCEAQYHSFRQYK